MLRQVIQVESISESIDKFGVLFYADMVIQEQAGGYFFIDVDMECPRVKQAIDNIKDCDVCIKTADHEENEDCEECKGMAKPQCGSCIDCVKPVPVKIAYFIIQAINLQQQAMAIHI